MLRIGKRGETMWYVIALILAAIVLVIWILGGGKAFGKGLGIVDNTLEGLEANKEFLKPWGDLSDDAKKELTEKDFNLALKKMLEEVDKKISDARSLATKDDFSSANNILSSAEIRVKEILSAIDKKRKEEKDEFKLKYTSEETDAKQKQTQIEGLKKDFTAKTSLSDVLKDIKSGKVTGDGAVSELEKALATNTGTISGAETRVEIFFNKYSKPKSSDVLKFKNEQMDGATSSLTKAEIGYTIGLIYEDGRLGLSKSDVKNKAIPQFRDVVGDYPEQMPFAPEAAYKVAKYTEGKKEQFALLKDWWNKYHGKYAEGNYESIENDIRSFVKKGYSEYEVYMELHGFVKDSDYNNDRCAEFCSYFGEPFTEPENYGVDCLDGNSKIPLTMTCDEYIKNEALPYEQVIFDIFTESYRFSAIPRFPVVGCEYGIKADGIGGSNVESVKKDAPVWIEFKVVDKLTSENVCNTYGENKLNYITAASFGSVADSYARFPAGEDCDDIIFATFGGVAESKLFNDYPKNDHEKAVGKVYLQICDAYKKGE